MPEHADSDAEYAVQRVRRSSIVMIQIFLVGHGRAAIGDAETETGTL